jgi:hypothetical protein
MRFLFYTVVLVVGSAILFFSHRYLWQRLVRDTELTGHWKKVATGLVIAASLLVPLGMALGRHVPREISEKVTVPAVAWLGFALYLVIGLLIWELPKRRFRQNRRTFLARTAAGVALAGATGTFYIGNRNAYGEIATPTTEIRLSRLPRALDGLKIVQLSDVHVGPVIDRRFIHSVAEKVKELKPDLLVITGDLVDGVPKNIGADVSPLLHLPSRFGTFFVTGNHEYYSGADTWIRFLDQGGMRVLLNEYTAVGDAGPGGATIDLAGIPDRQGRFFMPNHVPDLNRALEGRDPERELILLAHRPSAIHDTTGHQVGLQLSGHTHGGQLWPLTRVMRYTHPYLAGLYSHNEQTQIYVSRGTGFWGPPMRIDAPAEIASLILTV